MKKFIAFIIFPIIISACEEEIPTDNLNYTEKLVVNEYFSNTAPFSIEVSVSRDAYKKPGPFVLDPSRVNVVLTEDGVPMDWFYNDGVFNSIANPKPGKVYNLSVTSNTYGDVSTKGVLPGNIAGKSSTYIPDGGKDLQGNLSDLLKIKFTDNGTTKDYYKLNFYYYDESKDKYFAFDFELKDILSAVTTLKTRDGGFLFSDEAFNGKEKEFTAVAPFGFVAGNTGPKYLIQIQRLNEDYWKYNTSIELYRGTLNGGSSSSNIFGGAVVVYTNITNGLGIFAGSNIESDTLR